MAERFVYSTGTISIANGASTVTGTGTAWGGRDRAGSQIIAIPVDAAPFLVGIVAEVDPRGIYDDLELPLVAPYNGDALVAASYVVIDGPAIANGATQAAIYARLNSHFEQNAGLVYSTADDVDMSLVQNNSVFVDEDTLRLKRWRNGVLEPIANGVDAAAFLFQDAEPDTDYPANSIWVDSDSTDQDIFRLQGSPLAWADTGKNFKGAAGSHGIDGASALSIVRIVATSNVAIATALENGDSLDAVTLATNDLVLLTGQTAPAENGVYVVAASGAASRATAFAAYNDHPGRYFSVMEGTAKHDTLWRCTSDKGGTLGTTAIVFSEVTGDVAASTHAAASKAVPDDADEIPLVDSAASNALKKLPWSNLKSALAPSRSRIINPSGMIAQAGLASTADGAYTGFDQWIALTQSNPITPSALTNVENGTPYMMRLTQANASVQRFGLIQWLESVNSIDLRGQSVFLTARVRMSASMTLRYAIVEWAGTADTITKDIVNSWTNTTFTAGQFFTSTTTTIVATGSVALTANTLASVALSGTISGSMTNLAVFFWTDSTQAQNVTLDIGNVDLKRSLVASAFEARSYQEELYLCKRYYQKIALAPSALAIDGYTNTVSANVALNLPLSPSMRATPSASSSGTPTVSNLNSATPGFQSSADYSQAIWVVTAANTRYFVITNASGTSFLFDARL
jgi:hypothetical protein